MYNSAVGKRFRIVIKPNGGCCWPGVVKSSAIQVCRTIRVLNLYPKPFHPGPTTPGRDLTAASIYHCPPTNSCRYPQRRRLGSVVVIPAVTVDSESIELTILHTAPDKHRYSTRLDERTSQFSSIFYRRRRQNDSWHVIIMNIIATYLFNVSVHRMTSISRRFQDLKHEMWLIDNNHDNIYTQTNLYGETLW